MLNPDVNVPVLVHLGFLAYHVSINGSSEFDEVTITLLSNEVLAVLEGK